MQFVQVNDTVIHYSWTDNQKERTFLFINSLGTDLRIWDEVAEAMNKQGNILRFDKRGHGLSNVVASTKGLKCYMNDAVALMEYLSINKCTVVGLSVGGMIAQLLAYHHPERIDKLVLCDTRHKIGNEAVWNERITAVSVHGIPEISEGVMRRWFSESFRVNCPHKVAGYRNMLERTPVQGYIQACKAIRDADLTQVARDIKATTICIAGSEDQSTTPREVKNLADLIEGSRYEVIIGSGHIPCVDNPEALSNLIIDFTNT